MKPQLKYKHQDFGDVRACIYQRELCVLWKWLKSKRGVVCFKWETYRSGSMLTLYESQ